MYFGQPREYLAAVVAGEEVLPVHYRTVLSDMKN